MKSKELQKNTEENDIDYDQQQEETFHPIDLLQVHGINVSDISKLRDAGFNSIESVTYSTKKTLVSIKGLSEIKVEKIIDASLKICQMGFTQSNIYLEKRKNLVY